jgi:DNA repair exonuclease SbcCD ATPase subunit
LNPKPFITIELTPKGRLPKNAQVPDGARLRLVANNSLPADRLRRAIEIAKHRFKPECVTFLNRAAGKRGSVEGLAESLKTENLRDPSVQERLITEYLKDYEVGEDELDRVFELNRKYSTLAQESEDVSRNVDWRLESLEWDNLFNYGEDNKVDFKKLNGIVGIFGKNYSGKSSTIDGLLYTMFNSTSKNERKNLNIINQNKEGCRGVVKASIGDETYEIHRTSEKYVKRLKGEETTEAKTDVEFFKTNLLGEKEELNGLTRNDTDKKIRKIFGTMEDFLLTSMASQLGSLSFIGEGSTRRKEILAKFLDLEIFEKKFRMSKDDSAGLTGALKLLEGKDFINLITAASGELQDNNATIDAHTATCDVTREKIKSVQALLRDVESQIAAIPTQLVDYDAAQEELGSSELELYKADTTLETLQQDYHETEKLLASISAFLSDIDIDDILVKRELLAAKQEDLAGLNSLIKLLDREQVNNQKKMKMLETHEYDPDCEYCNENKFVKDAHTAKERFAENAAKLATLHNKGADIQKDISALNEPEILKKHTQYEKLAGKKSEVERKLTQCELDTARNKTAKLAAEHNIQRLLKEIETYHENKEAIDQLAQLNKQKRRRKKNIYSLNGTLEKCDNELKELYVKRGSLEQQVESLRNQKQELEDLRNQFSAYDLYMRCMHSNGIAYDIIKKKLPAINDEIAKVLTNIVNFEVYLESADKRLNIFIKHPKFEARPLEMGSGAEKTIAAMAIRLALLTVSSLPKGDIFILDEPGTALDEENMEGFVRILDLIKAQFKTILLISHLDSLKDCVDSQIVIEKKDGYAFINN